MDDNKDFDLSISNNLKDKNISVCEEVTENINVAVNPLPDIEKPLSETSKNQQYYITLLF